MEIFFLSFAACMATIGALGVVHLWFKSADELDEVRHALDEVERMMEQHRETNEELIRLFQNPPKEGR